MNNRLYSSFSQTKGLTWTKWFDGILSGNFLPPLASVLDLTDKCNLHCSHCNAQGFRSKNMLTTDHVKFMAKKLADWGVKSVCYAGGGEPTLHPDFAEIVSYSKKVGLEVGISTNGTLITNENAKVIADNCRFCGFSVDAAKPSTWTKTKVAGVDLWNNMLKGALTLNGYAKNTDLDTTYKFMITPFNQHEIFKAGVLARKLGFKSFFVRPAAYENVPSLNVNWRFDVKTIVEQLKRVSVLETENFRVYASFNRVNSRNLNRVIPFKKCLITPVMTVLCADGYAYLCIDYRERSYGRLCKHEDLFTYWGSEEHKKLINSIDLNKCPRCAMGNYNEQIKAYTEDSIFRYFA